MPVERIYHCDGPANPQVEDEIADEMDICPLSQSTMKEQAPSGWITVVERGCASCGDGDTEFNFCSWDCAMRFAAKIPPSEVIRLDQEQLDLDDWEAGELD